MQLNNILITGGLGYVGGRLSAYFAELGYQVYSLSRNKTIDHPNIKVLTNKQVLNGGYLDNHKIEVVIHLASTNEIECSQNPIFSNEVNINGTLEWLQWSKEKDVSQFIYFSTVHVYARPLEGTFNEKSICKPNHPYSISHKAAEDFVEWYRTDFNLNTKIVRLSNSFGYPAFPTANRWTLFINDICKQIAKDRKFVIKSNVLQHRDFISLTEVCIAVEKLIGYQIHPLENNIFNLSKGHSRSLLEIAELVKDVAEGYLNEKVSLIFDESKNQIAKKVLIKNDKLQSVGWNSTSNNDHEEIRKTIEYFITYPED